ncbi:MAG: hypothetical protein AAGH17_08005 [Pseudomonadota bacterium]
MSFIGDKAARAAVRGGLALGGGLSMLVGLGFLTWVGYRELADLYGDTPSALIFGLAYLCLGLGLLVLAKPKTKPDLPPVATKPDEMTALITAFIDGLAKGRAARQPR